MNKANMQAREKSAVDIVNATLLLIEMEQKRFLAKQELVWQSDDVLTAKGRALMKEVFEDINVGDYDISDVEPTTHSSLSRKSVHTKSMPK